MTRMENQPPKRLVRSSTDRVLAGVCGGLAEYFAIDSVLVRGVFFVAVFMGGFGIALYILLLILMPADHEAAPTNINHVAQRVRDEVRRASDSIGSRPWLAQRRNIFALILIFLGISLLFNQLFPFALLRWDLFWPLVLVAIGVLLLARHSTYGNK